MAAYYDYYLGYMKDNKIYPLGLYNAEGKMVPVISDSQSFASDLYELFDEVQIEQFSDELKKEFSYTVYGSDTVLEQVRYLKISDLPTDSYIKSGYFLISDIDKYESCKSDDYFDERELFYEHLTPVSYSAKAMNELKFGKPTPELDCEGEELPVYSAGDYAFYAYPDYHSKEYDASFIRRIADKFEFHDDKHKGCELVVLEATR